MTSIHKPKRVFDVDLFESAAKAAGITLEWWDDTEMLQPGYQVPDTKYGHAWKRWDPLLDDGDALRLAVKLGLRIYTPDDDDKTAVVRDYAGLHVTQEASTMDFCAATRIAIIRAAAIIGETKCRT